MSRSHPETTTPLTHNDVRLLGQAVRERVALGNWSERVGPDVAAFDKRMKDTRAALRKVRELKRQGL